MSPRLSRRLLLALLLPCLPAAAADPVELCDRQYERCVDRCLDARSPERCAEACESRRDACVDRVEAARQGQERDRQQDLGACFDRCAAAGSDAVPCMERCERSY